MPDPRLARLRSVILELGSLALAYSGGSDSTLVLKVALDVLGPDKVLAVIAHSWIFPPEETVEAERLARELGAQVLVLDTHDLDVAGLAANREDRCVLCKSAFFARLREAAVSRGLAEVADGTNADDLAEGRPSFPALEKAGVRHPLAAAGLSKADVRELSRELALLTWDKTARPCLASRVSFGIELTPERLARIHKAERALKDLGFSDPLVRYHAEEMARVRLAADELPRAVEPDTLAGIVSSLKGLGFDLVVLDLGGV